MPTQSVQKKARQRSSKNIQTAAKQATEEARLIADENGMILYTSDAFKALCHFDGSLKGQAFEVLFDGKSIDELQNNHHDLQIVTIAPTQKKLALQFDWIDMPGGLRYLIASAEEITAREKLKQFVEEKIKAQNKTQKKNKKEQDTLSIHPFIEMSHDACVISDNSDEIIYTNKSFTSLLGYELSDKVDFIDLIHEDDKAHVHRALQDFRELAEEQENSNYDFDAKTISKTGHVRDFEWKIKSQMDQIFFLGRDVTASKEQDEQLKKQRKNLREAEAIAHMGHWRWPVGAENLILSHEVFNIFGLDKNAFTPTLDNINAMLFREDAGRMTQVFQRAIIEKNDYDIDFRLNRPDGEVRYVRCEGRCEVDEEDDVIALYGIMQDITETVLREQDLVKAKNSAERAYAAKSQFLANMSHELRTPLNAIIGFSEMMQHQLLGPIGNERYVEYISGIRESGEHLLDLISDILDMSKIEAGKYELHLEKFNLSKTIKLALHMMESRAIDSNLKLIAAIKNDNLEIIADRRAIMQMVLNLLSNAVKFSKENGKITIVVVEKETCLQIKVRDEGIGIPANKLANITKPFEQVGCSYTREHEGSGLGLSITKELAEAHQGTLDVQSVLDEGTCVTIQLPYKAENKK